MLLSKTQLLWRCTESWVLVGGVGAAGLGRLRVVIDHLWRESAVGGGFRAQVHACGGGGGGGRGLKVNWLCGLPGISETTKKRQRNPQRVIISKRSREHDHDVIVIGIKAWCFIMLLTQLPVKCCCNVK